MDNFVNPKQFLCTFRLSSLSLAIGIALTSPLSYALTDQEWIDLPRSWSEYRLWTSGSEDHTGKSELVLESSLLSSRLNHGDFRDAVIGLVNYSGFTAGDFPNTVHIGIQTGDTLTIDMNNNPHAGILVARTSTDRVASWTGHPSLTINSSLKILGNIGGQKATDVGDFTSGIAIGLGELDVKGDLFINLEGMDSQSYDERKSVPDYGGYPLWQQYYGWTVFDDRRGSGHESNLTPINTSYLLQGGVITGIAGVNIEKNATILVRGRHGILGGWIMAPNVELWQNASEWQGEAPVTIGGDLSVYASLDENTSAYGLFGVGLQGSYSSNEKINPILTVDGALAISIDGKKSQIKSIWQDTPPTFSKSDIKKLEKGNAEALLISQAKVKASSVDIQVTNVGSANYAGGIEIYSGGALTAGGVDIKVNLPSSEIATAFGILGTSNPNQTSQFGPMRLNVKSNAKEIYGLFWQDSELTLNDNIEIQVSRLTPNKEDSNPIAVKAGSGIYDTIINLTPSNGKTLKIEGDITVEANNAAIHADFGPGSYLKGAGNVDLYESMSREELDDFFEQYPGYWVEDLDLKFHDGAYWNVTEDSQVTHLSLTNNAQVRLALDNNEEVSKNTSVLPGFGSHILNIRHFSGVPSERKKHAGILHLELDQDKESSVANRGGFIAFIDTVDSQRPYVALEVASTGTMIAQYSKGLILDSTPEKNLQVELVNHPVLGQKAEIGAYLYELKSYIDIDGTIAKAYADYFKESSQDENFEYFAEAGDRYYYLERTDETSPTANDTSSIASFGLQISQYLMHLDMLRNRLGDIRYASETGSWIKTSYSKDRIRGVGGRELEAKNHLLVLGADSNVGSTPWKIGTLFRVHDSDGVGSGETSVNTNGQGLGMTVYATYSNNHYENGGYVDLTASLDHYDQEIKGLMSDGLSSYNGEYKTFAWGTSIETGYQWRSESNINWFIEPSLQLSYYRIKGERFQMTNGMILDQKTADSLTGRVGTVVGYTSFNNDKKDYEIYAKFGLLHEFLGEETVRVNDAVFTNDILGTRIYYGLGFSKILNDSCLIWGNLSRESGDDYSRSFEGQLGIRLLF